MVRSLAVLALALVTALVPLAGCASDVGPGANTPAPGEPDPTSRFSLSEPSQVAPKPNNQVEAAVSVSADGRTVLTCFHGLFQQTSPGYASTDGGESWTRMSFPAEAGPGGDCETAITPDGAWAFLASTVAGATVMVTQDQGETWTVNQAAAIPINGLADRPWLEAVGEQLWLAYMPVNFQPGTIGFTKSTDYGETWSVPEYIGTPSEEEVSVRHGHFAIGDEAVHLPMVRYRSNAAVGDRIAQVATTADGGQTWTVEEIHRSEAIVPDWPSLAMTEHGDLLLLVTAEVNGTVGPHLLHRAPDADWTAPRPVHVPEGGSSATWPWIAGGHGRNATFIVSGGEHNGTDHAWIGRVDAAGLTVQTYPIGPEPAVEFASVDHDAQGNAYAVWTDDEVQWFTRGKVGA